MSGKDDISRAPESGQQEIHGDQDVEFAQRHSQTAGDAMEEKMGARSGPESSIQHPRIDSSQMQPSMKGAGVDEGERTHRRVSPEGYSQTVEFGVYDAKEKHGNK